MDEEWLGGWAERRTVDGWVSGWVDGQVGKEMSAWLEG